AANPRDWRESNRPKRKRASRSPPAIRNAMFDLTIEDVVADRGDALQPPARRNVARVEEQGIADFRVLQVLIDDLRDCDGRLPLPARARHGRQRPAVDEGELPALEQHAAIGRRKTA